jgi:nitrite reductase (NADH) small subunit
MAEHDVGALDDFPAGTHRVVAVKRIKLGIFNLDGTLYALPNICPHQHGPLCEGPTTGQWLCPRETGWHHDYARAGEIIVCPWHGIEFDIRTGQCLSSPKWRVRQYPVRVDGDRVVVSL